MKLPLHLLLLLILIGLAATAARADEDTTEPSTEGEVLARLSTDDPAAMAWGAYLAGRDGHREAIPPILDLLRSHVEPHTKTWHAAHRSALDALIRLDARVPGALLARHEGRLPIHVLILRARDPEAHVDVLRERFAKLVDGKHVGHIGLATGNLLLQVRAAGFASDLLGGIHLELGITVYTPGPDDGIGGGSGSRVVGGSSDGSARVAPGFPPYVWYQLLTRPLRPAVLLATGPHPVFYERRERARSGLAVGGSMCRLETTKTCLEWLGALLGVEPKALGIETERKVYVGWTTPEAYRERVAASQEKLLAPYWATAQRLIDAKCLTLDEACALAPRVTTHVKDDRSDKSDALPKVPALVRPAWAEAPAPR